MCDKKRRSKQTNKQTKIIIHRISKKEIKEIITKHPFLRTSSFPCLMSTKTMTINNKPTTTTTNWPPLFTPSNTRGMSSKQKKSQSQILAMLLLSKYTTTWSQISSFSVRTNLPPNSPFTPPFSFLPFSPLYLLPISGEHSGETLIGDPWWPPLCSFSYSSPSSSFPSFPFPSFLTANRAKR